jgi:hypothetical protein
MTVDTATCQQNSISEREKKTLKLIIFKNDLNMPTKYYLDC